MKLSANDCASTVAIALDGEFFDGEGFFVDASSPIDEVVFVKFTDADTGDVIGTFRLEVSEVGS